MTPHEEDRCDMKHHDQAQDRYKILMRHVANLIIANGNELPDRDKDRNDSQEHMVEVEDVVFQSTKIAIAVEIDQSEEVQQNTQ